MSWNVQFPLVEPSLHCSAKFTMEIGGILLSLLAGFLNVFFFLWIFSPSPYLSTAGTQRCHFIRLPAAQSQWEWLYLLSCRPNKKAPAVAHRQKVFSNVKKREKKSNKKPLAHGEIPAGRGRNIIQTGHSHSDKYLESAICWCTEASQGQ